MEDLKSGNVGSSDTSDLWAVQIPENMAANITLDWEANVDLDLYVYSNSDGTGTIDYSWWDQPEFVDLGAAYAGTTVFVKVEYWYFGSVDPAAGYTLLLQLSPSVDPPCWTQDDGGTGDDAGDTTTDATNVSSSAMEGTLTGMVSVSYTHLTLPTILLV